MVLICIYLVHVAMKVLLKNAMRQFYESFLEGSFYHRVSVFRYYNQVVFKVIATVPISAIAQWFYLLLCRFTTKCFCAII